MRLAAQPWLGTALTVAAAVLVTAQAFNAPPRPHRARDIVPASGEMQAQLAAVCQMYPAECQFNADGSVARVIGRRVVPGTDRAVLNHFQTEIGAVRPEWDAPAVPNHTSGWKY
jgi:hypothetical protein